MPNFLNLLKKHRGYNHLCSIKNTSEEYIKLSSSKSDWSFYKLRNFFYKIIQISENNHRSRIFFRSNASIEFERKRHAMSKYKWVVHPFSLFRFIWETLIMGIILFSLFLEPLNVARNFLAFFTAKKAKATYLALWSDLACVTHLLLNCFTGYPNYYTKEIYLNPRTIIKCYYENGDLIMDILTSFPFHALRHIPLLRKARYYITMYSLIKMYRLKTFCTYAKNISMNWHINTILFKFFVYVLVCLIALHWGTCILIIIPYYIKLIETSTISWIDYEKFTNIDLVSHYNAAIYLATSTFLCMRYSEKPIESMADTIMFTLLYCIGYVMCILIFVIILQIVLSYNAPSTKYESIMSQLSQYMRHRQLPVNLQNRLVQYYGHRFRRSYFNETAIMSILSDRLQLEINLHCYTTLVKNVTILHDLPESIVNEVVSNLRAEVFLPNDSIIKAGTVGDCMYFISSGTVTVSTPTGREVCHLQDGAYFGEVALIRKDQKRIANVLAIEICEVYKLDRRVFKLCLANNPEVFKKMEKIAQDRYNRTNFLEELHKKHILEKTLARKHDLSD